ncbi:O-antigen ligase family protein [Commensalibacter oyaizuii]|uniref:O-antigen ligase family protein n=1 Tax=Commensalibacter oyaizuii TaxID=3043873 RepID=A0ABT6Q393_9PROT|nr:O-antigen ligase family protein [Commensalibacter sp. TBRC 16381]MDI2091575.1 O-antigen ligase family protein [Commensalibacter sp. TBRC 16381]
MDSIYKFLHHTSLGSALILPLFLTHFRGIADGLMSYIAICFLLHSILQKDWDWARQSWIIIAFIWWGWLLICSIPFGSFLRYGGQGNILEAFVVVRFLIFVVAMQRWVLVDERHRRWIGYVIAGCCLYIVAQMLCQFVVGYNFFGSPRYIDGTLTGPYPHPRAAAPLSRILLPTSLVSVVFVIYTVKGWKGQLGALLILLFALAVLALAGQRMPFILFVMGLIIAVIWLRPLRNLALMTIGILPVVILITAFVSPRSFHHLVIRFIEQMSHFSSSPYGLVYNRAFVMGLNNPLAGLGYDAFKHACADPLYFRGWPFWDVNSGNGGGAIICLSHPHNHYLQALIDSGFPGLLCFIALVMVWLWELSKGLSAKIFNKSMAMKQAWRVGLFAAVFIHEWPFASTSNFVNMPLGGWFFLLLGLGLAYSWDYQKNYVNVEGMKNV